MPNWCTTTYAFTGEPDALKRFRIDLQNYTSKNYHENGFGETWLGNVISGFGLYPTEGNDATFSYRGNIAEMDWCNEVLYVTTDTAWSPTTEMWDVILDTHFQDKYGDRLIDYVFISEEPGMGLYINTDTDGTIFPERFLLEVGDIPEHRNWESYYLESEQEVIDLINEIFAVRIETLGELKEFLENRELDIDGTLLLHEYNVRWRE